MLRERSQAQNEKSRMTPPRRVVGLTETESGTAVPGGLGEGKRKLVLKGHGDSVSQDAKFWGEASQRVRTPNSTELYLKWLRSL